jgi:protocatechuate 3,4-dioxygenase beta subunit
MTLPRQSHDHDDFGGLARDLPAIIGRRRMLSLIAGAGVLTLVGCSDDSKTSSASTGASSSTTPAVQNTTTAIPQETAGPYPGDGSNGPNVLTQSGIVRSDITKGFGSSSATAPGVPLTVTLSLLDSSTGKARSGSAVYLWHCDRDGRYSLYSSGITDQNYLRGVQQSDTNGNVTFKTIFPACYSGRWPHIHFEVYPSLSEATKAGTPIATSQLALPEAVCNTVFATDGYSKSVGNLAQVTLARDNVFGDDAAVRQLPAMGGSVDSGLTAALTVPV